MRITVTGATGLIGSRLLSELSARGDELTVLSRDAERARAGLAGLVSPAPEVLAWDPANEPAPAEALAGRDAVIHLAGAEVAQRWSVEAKREIRDSRTLGTRRLVGGIAAAQPRPRVLISSSAIGYYGPRGAEPIDEEARPGRDFLAGVCKEWEYEARAAEQLGLRTVQVRTGIVLSADGGALKKMLPPFRLGLGGPVAGGRQYMAWIHRDDVVGIMLAALDDEQWSGPFNATAPEPVTNRDFSRALGRALHRPAIAPVPAFALFLLYGEMSEIVTGGARVLPAKALVLGYQFRHSSLDEALQDALSQ